MSSQVDERMVRAHTGQRPQDAMIAGIMLGLSVSHRYVESTSGEKCYATTWRRVDQAEWVDRYANIDVAETRGETWVRIQVVRGASQTTTYVHAHN